MGKRGTGVPIKGIALVLFLLSGASFARDGTQYAVDRLLHQHKKQQQQLQNQNKVSTGYTMEEKRSFQLIKLNRNYQEKVECIMRAYDDWSLKRCMR